MSSDNDKSEDWDWLTQLAAQNPEGFMTLDELANLDTSKFQVKNLDPLPPEPIAQLDPEPEIAPVEPQKDPEDILLEQYEAALRDRDTHPKAYQEAKKQLDIFYF